jgi:DNA-binding transcriptional MerR regulator
MESSFSIDELAEVVNRWCSRHRVAPANGQAGEQITARNIRYYRTLGLVDAPAAGGGSGFGEKHRLQLVALRLLQAQGLPLTRIRQLLFGRSLDELREIERRGLADLESTPLRNFQPFRTESWSVVPLTDDLLLVSRNGRGLSTEARERILAALSSPTATPAASRQQRKESHDEPPRPR